MKFFFKLKSKEKIDQYQRKSISESGGRRHLVLFEKGFCEK